MLEGQNFYAKPRSRLHLDFLAPTTLCLKEPPVQNVLLIGQCLLDAWPHVLRSIHPECSVERSAFNHAAQIASISSRRAAEMDFQVVSVPLRTVFNEVYYMSIEYDSIGDYTNLLDRCCSIIAFHLSNHVVHHAENGLLTFVVGFLVPIGNSIGRLTHQYDLRNLSYFVQRLNEYLSDTIKQRGDRIYFVNADHVASTIGKMYVQDDSMCVSTHNSILNDFGAEQDLDRLEPPTRTPTQHYTYRGDEFIHMMWREILAGYRTACGLDTVKVVIVDLDDVMWRGILGDAGLYSESSLEGWPLGLVEALSFLSRRGILLAISSKNDEQFIMSRWDEIFRGRILLSDFSIIRINWNTKVKNIMEILNVASLLPRSAVFIDDNPVERAAVKASFPDIRCIGSEIYDLRRILLWSAETQVPYVTKESGRRTEMIQDQEKREFARQAMSHAEFLDSLASRMSLRIIRSVDDETFLRAFELLNKTNQFNTSGKRWSRVEIQNALSCGSEIVCFSIIDRYTNYGIVGALLIDSAGCIRQFVMSCRVLGMNIELNALNETAEYVESKGQLLSATLTETSLNFACRDVYQRFGLMRRDGEMWTLPKGTRSAQSAIEIVRPLIDRTAQA